MDHFANRTRLCASLPSARDMGAVLQCCWIRDWNVHQRAYEEEEATSIEEKVPGGQGAGWEERVRSPTGWTWWVLGSYMEYEETVLYCFDWPWICSRQQKVEEHIEATSQYECCETGARRLARSDQMLSRGRSGLA